jgi:hypothetical protein
MGAWNFYRNVAIQRQVRGAPDLSDSAGVAKNRMRASNKI